MSIPNWKLWAMAHGVGFEIKDEVIEDLKVFARNHGYSLLKANNKRYYLG